MSQIRVRIELSNIDQKAEVDALERRLQALGGVEIHALGLSELELSYDQNELETQDLERVIQESGGGVRAIHRQQ